MLLDTTVNRYVIVFGTYGQQMGCKKFNFHFLNILIYQPIINKLYI